MRDRDEGIWRQVTAETDIFKEEEPAISANLAMLWTTDGKQPIPSGEAYSFSDRKRPKLFGSWYAHTNHFTSSISSFCLLASRPRLQDAFTPFNRSFCLFAPSPQSLNAHTREEQPTRTEEDVLSRSSLPLHLFHDLLLHFFAVIRI